MSAADAFLSRWSRRKLGATRSGEVDRTLPAVGPAPATTEPAAPDAPSGAAVPLSISAQDLVALPRIEDLTAETDLLPFLREGVPTLLRNAALRRMWSLDPAIRDFVGEARDYSYDWNVAGGVPVSGPLLPGDDAEATLARMFSRPYDDAARDDGPETSSGSDSASNPPGEPATIRPAGESPEATPDAMHGRTDGFLESNTPEPVILFGCTAPADVAVNAEFAEIETAELPPSSHPSRRLRHPRHGAARPKLD